MELHMDIQPAFHYAGDGRLMEKVFTNVVGNAVAYSPVGATVTVSLQNGIFFVENSGIHIAEEDWSVSSLHSTGWISQETGTAAAAALGCISPRPSWITMGYSTAWRIRRMECGLRRFCAERKCIAYRSGTSCAVSYTSLARFFKSSRSYKFLKTIFKPSHCME